MASTSSSVAAKLKRIRSSNWTRREVAILQELCIENRHILEAVHRDVDTEKRKRGKWKEITDKVNSVNASGHRLVKEVTKKWYNLKTAAKRTQADRRGRSRLTGGGSPPPELDAATQVTILTGLRFPDRSRCYLC